MRFPARAGAHLPCSRSCSTHWHRLRQREGRHQAPRANCRPFTSRLAAEAPFVEAINAPTSTSTPPASSSYKHQQHPVSGCQHHQPLSAQSELHIEKLTDFGSNNRTRSPTRLLPSYTSPSCLPLRGTPSGTSPAPLAPHIFLPLLAGLPGKQSPWNSRKSTTVQPAQLFSTSHSPQAEYRTTHSAMPLAEHEVRPAELVTDHLETPSLDDRTYRVIRLPNQLEALLVHDAQTDKASAAMDVNVGNFSDEPEMPGMAHAVEHVRKCPSAHLSLHSH